MLETSQFCLLQLFLFFFQPLNAKPLEIVVLRLSISYENGIFKSRIKTLKIAFATTRT